MRYGRVIRAAALLGVLVWAAGCSDGDDDARGSSAPPTVSTPATTGTPSRSPSEPAYYDNDDNVLMAKGDSPAACVRPVSKALVPGERPESANGSAFEE
ncbi:hypothetical protein [Streptomyces sp. NPDC050988]|uniref:hypothetical protein n=1 Tax=Streptomyces sp. NPDC050988 TaxID=3365637 RepID=UPI0037A4A6C4